MTRHKKHQKESASSKTRPATQGERRGHDGDRGLDRLQKILSRAGLGSRRACEELISGKHVRVDGQIVSELGSKADARRNKITVDGKPIKQERTVYYMVNKPRGVICTMEDDVEGKKITDFVPKEVRVYPVGRLEVDSEGLMVLTNDGALTHQLTHPSYGLSRVYIAHVEGEITEEATGRLQKGIYLAEGKTLPAEVRVTRHNSKGGTLEITIREGLNREVRRMLVAVGLKPKSIVRIRLGRLSLGDLPTGAYRVLEFGEIGKLRKGLSMTPSKPPAWIRRKKTNKGRSSAEPRRTAKSRPTGAGPGRRRRVIGGQDD
jgi:23S rRNA pseudouridine2605 synthase